SCDIGIDTQRKQLVATKHDVGTLKLKYWDILNMKEPRKDGYRFLGWYNGNTPIEFTKHFEILEDMNVTAHWEEL
ncbi:MAG: InlB B-repeat-containing protein, partial [Bacilli bacterium]|nr:InlB B-repeat-containing protein [Bacilli bacterium]